MNCSASMIGGVPPADLATARVSATPALEWPRPVTPAAVNPQLILRGPIAIGVAGRMLGGSSPPATSIT